MRRLGHLRRLRRLWDSRRSESDPSALDALVHILVDHRAPFQRRPLPAFRLGLDILPESLPVALEQLPDRLEEPAPGHGLLEPVEPADADNHLPMLRAHEGAVADVVGHLIYRLQRLFMRLRTGWGA